MNIEHRTSNIEHRIKSKHQLSPLFRLVHLRRIKRPDKRRLRHRILNGKNGMDRIIGKDKEFFSSPSEFPNRVNVFLCELCLPRSSGRWYWGAFAGGPAARGLFGSV